MVKGIGVFDSGLGGLTVVSELRKALPSENIVYFGDTARLPYGSKSPESVIEFSRQNSKFLLKENVKIIVVACNTATSLALRNLRNEFTIPFLGVVEPGARFAIEMTRNCKIGVIGTSATIASKTYEDAIYRMAPHVEVYSQACPLLVPLVENSYVEMPETVSILKRYIKPLDDSGIDTLILGCTHYPLLKDKIQELFPHFQLVDSARTVAEQAYELLSIQSYFSDQETEGSLRCFVSDFPVDFKKNAEMFLGMNIGTINKIKVWEDN